MEAKDLSAAYRVRRLNRDDVEAIYNLCRENHLFFRYHPPAVTRESILDDMAALPPGKTQADKLYVGFFDGETLIAVMDLILGYPAQEIAFIGFFMTDVRIQRRGIGSKIIGDTAACLASQGYEKIRLGVDRGNPQSFSFWSRNSFRVTGENTYILMERTL